MRKQQLVFTPRKWEFFQPTSYPSWVGKVPPLHNQERPFFLDARGEAVVIAHLICYALNCATVTISKSIKKRCVD